MLTQKDSLLHASCIMHRSITQEMFFRNHSRKYGQMTAVGENSEAKSVPHELVRSVIILEPIVQDLA